MEVLAVAISIVGGVAVLLWRSRAGTTRGPESALQGIPSEPPSMNAGFACRPEFDRPWPPADVAYRRN